MTKEIEKELFDRYGIPRDKLGYNCFGKKSIHAETTYPSITAEKILKLIKFLVQKYGTFQISKINGITKSRASADYRWGEWMHEGMLKRSEDEVVLSLINKIHSHLTDQERKDVKDILEG